MYRRRDKVARSELSQIGPNERGKECMGSMCWHGCMHTRTLHTDLEEVIAHNVRGTIKEVLCGRYLRHKLFAHAHRLGALPWEEKGNPGLVICELLVSCYLHTERGRRGGGGAMGREVCTLRWRVSPQQDEGVH
jgi:hypothetical protein